MELQTILSRLCATIEKLEELKPEQFSYLRFVTEFDHNAYQGKVCDVAGWYPVWFPEAGFKYCRNGALMTVKCDTFHDFTRALMKYHGLSASIIRCLFHGKSIEKTFPNINWKIEVKSNPRDSLGMVVRTFKKVHDLLKDGTMQPHIEY